MSSLFYEGKNEIIPWKNVVAIEKQTYHGKPNGIQIHTPYTIYDFERDMYDQGTVEYIPEDETVEFLQQWQQYILKKEQHNVKSR